MEDFYPKPDEALKKRRLVEYTTRFIEPLFPDDRTIRIGDIGCGYGLFLDACKRSGYTHIEGAEQTEAYVTYATQELGISSIECADIFTYLESKKDAYFDIITAFNIVEHVKRDKVQYLLSLIQRKLKKDGMFLMEVPNADSPLGIHTYFTDLTHEFAFSRKLAVMLLKNAGLTDIKVMYQPMRKNVLIKIAQKILAKVVGFDYQLMFSGNIILAGYKK
ncbi:MAG: methyltransferase domain-containing protein [bacterium]|nr:methyltransferase domain-containing protein [bacterium]MDO8742390.1 methyltransferase domain-containing protein [bacterium]